MINHIQTLLINEDAETVAKDFGTASRWYTDPSFVPATVTGNLEAILDMLLPPSTADEARRRLDFYLRCFTAPEFTKYFQMFDTRMTGVEQLPGSIAEFYRGLAHVDLDVVHPVVTSRYSSQIFLKVGDTDIDAALAELYEIYGKSREDIKRFTAVVFAVALNLEYLRIKRSR